MAGVAISALPVSAAPLTGDHVSVAAVRAGTGDYPFASAVCEWGGTQASNPHCIDWGYDT